MSRLENTTKNIVWMLVNKCGVSVFNLMKRLAFVYILGKTFLGVEGLFTQILTVLALSDLGLESAITFCLYQPLAEKNNERLASIMTFYKKAYYGIAMIVALIGCALIPFLPYIVKGAEGVEHITFIYILYLFNTVITYIFSYKVTLIVADQKQYIYTNFSTIFEIALAITQSIALVLTHSFYIYLLINSVIIFLQYMTIARYADRMYPFLKEKGKPLAKSDIMIILHKIKGMLFFRFSDTCILQTDNIIISAILGVGTVGILANYNMFIKIVTGVSYGVLTAAVASLGNVVVTEKPEERLRIFQLYDYIGYWMISWCTICLFVLCDPVIEFMFGKDYLFDKGIVSLICINFYFAMTRSTIGQIKVAAGLYEKDRWIAVSAAVINIIISIFGAKRWGILGVELGTLASCIVLQISYPVFVYKPLFEKSAWKYFNKMIPNFVIMVCAAGVTEYVAHLFETKYLVVDIIVRILLCCVIPNVFILIFTRSREECLSSKQILKKFLIKKSNL